MPKTTTINGFRYRGIKRYTDKTGKVRYYFRATHAALPDPANGFRQFDLAYWEAVKGERTRRQKRPIEQRPESSRDGTIEKAVRDYLGSTTFASLKRATQRTRDHLLRAWAKNVGTLLVATLRQEDIERGMTSRRAQPPTANKWLSAVRMFLDYCVESKRYGIKKNPTAGVKRLKVAKTAGFAAWTEADIPAFVARFPKGTKEYLAMELALVLGQRRGDIIRFGWHMVTDDNMIEFEQQKTGTKMRLPIPASLLEVLPPRSNIVGIDGKPDETPFLLTSRGTPFQETYFTNWMCKAWAEVGKPLSVHGARKLGAQRLYRTALRAGRTDALAITMAFTGHKTERQLRTYLGENFEQNEYADELGAYMT